MYGEERIYEHLLREKENYESYKRTSFYLVERKKHSEKFMDGLKHIFDSIINLDSTMPDGIIDRFVSVEKSPLPDYSVEKMGYEISPNPGEIVFLGVRGPSIINNEGKILEVRT
jgi:KaiC/GvpD/RAD55 family RecA-like ATPase